jgi:peptidoglycan/xylan/chitin deacetylase (PgdA/CDA1 family)
METDALSCPASNFRQDGQGAAARTAGIRRLRPQPEPLVDGLSVDVEDYFQVEAFATQIPRSAWSSFTPRVRRNVARILDLFEEHRCRATFFVLGWVAEREPGLIREIVQAGHELGCHSHLHRPLYELSPEEFRNDLRRSREIIENLGVGT